MTRRPVGTVVALVTLALGCLTACGSAGGKGSEPTKTATGGAITVGAYDIRFDVGEIMTAPGPLSITLVNHGAMQHTFKIKGTSLMLSTNPGESATGTVTLTKGTYEFECTIPGHAGQGQRGTVVVG